jgi:DNA polymerase III epsilon subunit family exonuclease
MSDLATSLAAEANGGGDGYAHLALRAEAFLQERGGAAPEDVLIAHVFGSAGSPALWRPLLRSLLAGAERLTLRADGFWMVPTERPATSGTFLDEFVCIDVETTGLHVSRQRIIEIAAIRYHAGSETERFESLVNPRRRLPKYVADLTGLTDADLADGPPFEQIAGPLAAFLGDALLVGHNVAFDLGFLNAELARAGLPGLVNERLDTMGLAVRLMPAIRKPSLDAVAQKLGIARGPRGRHRAGSDAVTTAQVALRLAEHARDAGCSTIDDLRALGSSLPKRPNERHARAGTLIDRSLLADVPKRPGVYLFRNAFDQIVYVGKAKNLRDRVGSYFSQQLGYTRKMDGLLESLAAIETVVVGSELEALLLETQLIRRYQPRYNTALRAHEQYPFIRVDIANPWPRITLAKSRKADGAAYFGPFRNASSARRTVELLNRVVPLRTCPRSFKDARSYGSPCIELDLGRCLGPCVGKADRDQYRGLVGDVVKFLDGRDETLYELLWKDLEAAAENLDFERAEKIRRELRHVSLVVASQRRIRAAVECATCLLVVPAAEPGQRSILVVSRGRLWASIRAADADGPEPLAERLAVSWDRLRAVGAFHLDHDTVDEAHILHRWMASAAADPGTIALQDDPDWLEAAAAALAPPLVDLPWAFPPAGAADPDDDAGPAIGGGGEGDSGDVGRGVGGGAAGEGSAILADRQADTG